MCVDVFFLFGTVGIQLVGREGRREKKKIENVLERREKKKRKNEMLESMCAFRKIFRGILSNNKKRKKI